MNIHETDYKTGLNQKQVEERIEKGLVNKAVDSVAKTTREIVLENTFTYFNMIFIFLAVLVCIAGSFRSLTFLPVVIGNTLIGIYQEIRARNVLEKMSILNAPSTIVVRDGQEKEVNSESLVADDIVIFRGGEQIPADAVVVKGEISVNESLLTGESDELTKTPGMHLLSGSFIVSGECYARLEKVGEDSYISRLTLEAKKMGSGEQSEMIRSINKLVKWVGIAIIPVGIILFVQSYVFNDEGFRQSIVSMVAAVIGMIPEGLYLLTTVALAVSTIRLAKQKVLLHDMKSIETLARVDVLCVDKTGTITENKMTVNELIEAEDIPEGESKNLETLLSDFAANMTSDNITMEAIQERFTEVSGRVAVNKTSFSSKVKYCSVTYSDGAFVLGAPEMILRDDYQYYEESIGEYTKKGYRVIAFGKYLGTVDGKPLTEKVIPYGFITLSNAVREKAPDTFKYFEKQGVDVKVISGDNPETVSEVARQAMISGAENFVDATSLATDADIESAVNTYTVFGRVTPKQKQKIVNALQEQGHTVAMTGDGVNDILAMKDADCSVAMASGSEATAQASQVVLLESDFSCMPSVVLEGRRVVNNIQRSASLFLVKNIFSFLLSIFAAVFMITYPLEPSQISLISGFTIGIPAFFLAMEPNKSRIKGKFIINVFLRALPAGLTDVIAVGAIVLCGRAFGLSSGDVATAATMLLAIIGFMILFKISEPLNRFRVLVLIGSIVGLLVCGIFLKDVFALKGMSSSCVLLFVMFSFASESMFRWLTLSVKKMKRFKTIERIVK
ncbi:cation-translocating P-type ATPase [uncultured Eubacterium sp.]|uniref:cation-translocating P-type ATPase n=1 Tax=uncultured Eubacterium sp. TaxID=165185 RepID=UPI0026717063|nr:cation-translocating P-type ATPase [uncultured Eubacterium sp.]